MTDSQIANKMTPKQIEHEIEAAFQFLSPVMAVWGHAMVLNHKGDTQDCPECWPEKTTE